MPCKACKDSGSIRCYIERDMQPYLEVNSEIGTVRAFDRLTFRCPSCLVDEGRWSEAKDIIAEMTKKVGAGMPHVMALVWSAITEQERRRHRLAPWHYDRAAG